MGNIKNNEAFKGAYCTT